MLEIYENYSENHCWNMGLKRCITDWEIEVENNLSALLQKQKLHSSAKDSILWKLANNGNFFVISSYDLTYHTRVQCGGRFGERYIPPRVSFSVWEAWWGKILTLDNLRKKGFHLATWRYLCQEDEDTVDHLLILCDKTRILRKLTFSTGGKLGSSSHNRKHRSLEQKRDSKEENKGV